MQQFTVPQFIDVENKIIGPITVRQFIIFLAAAIIIGGSYRLFDFSLFSAIAIGVLVLAALFAFVKINGQPFHLFVLSAVQTLRRPRIRIWNNRLMASGLSDDVVAPKPQQVMAVPKVYKSSRLAELSLVVDTKGRYRGE
jgi:hypothetical protein